ncbi:ParE family toxin-like protein [Trichothermofontia sp.]
MHRTTPQFWQRFYALPDPVQRIARKNYDLLKVNLSHPSLNFKKVGQYWSVRVGLSHRALAIEDGPDLIWVWIGGHNEYDRLLR